MAAIDSAARLRPAVIIILSFCRSSTSFCARLRAHGDTSECGNLNQGLFLSRALLHVVADQVELAIPDVLRIFAAHRVSATAVQRPEQLDGCFQV